MRVTRRGLQIALGGAWLLDGALQCQPYMFTRAFAREVLRPSGDGQPIVVAGPIHVAASVVAAHPVAFNAVFAGAQLLIGLALLVRRSAPVALAASIAWSVAVWWLGEGFGGLLSGHAMLLTGAPGAVILYALVAIAAWPARGGCGHGEPPRRFAVGAWAAVWVGGALVQLLPGQNTPGALADALGGSDSPTPDWLTGAGHTAARAAGHDYGPLVALVLLEVLVGVFALVPGFPRLTSVAAGSALAAGFWMFGQGFGELLTGQSTDPDSGPLLVLLGVAAAGVVAARRGATRATASHPGTARGLGLGGLPDRAPAAA